MGYPTVKSTQKWVTTDLPTAGNAEGEVQRASTPSARASTLTPAFNQSMAPPD